MTKPILLAMDLESILVPEIWPAVACRHEIPALKVTTRDVGDYPTLMRKRLEVSRAAGLTLADIVAVVDGLEPLPGALDFLDWARRRGPVVVVSDTFHELAAPLMERLDHPLLLCHHLEIDAQGFVSGFRLREPAGKAPAVRAFQSLGYTVTAVGDSHNDLDMLAAAEASVLFRPPASLASVGFPVVESFSELQRLLTS